MGNLLRSARDQDAREISIATQEGLVRSKPSSSLTKLPANPKCRIRGQVRLRCSRANPFLAFFSVATMLCALPLSSKRRSRPISKSFRVGRVKAKLRRNAVSHYHDTGGPRRPRVDLIAKPRGGLDQENRRISGSASASSQPRSAIAFATIRRNVMRSPLPTKHSILRVFDQRKGPHHLMPYRLKIARKIRSRLEQKDISLDMITLSIKMIT